MTERAAITLPYIAVMRVSDLLSIDRIACAVEAESKWSALERLAGLIAAGRPALSREEVYEGLLSRERLASTGVGQGVALPHFRMGGNQGPVGALLQLREAIDFDSIDRVPVDLLFALVVPEEASEQHLELLAQLAEMFGDADFRNALRDTTQPAAILRLFREWRGERQ